MFYFDLVEHALSFSLFPLNKLIKYARHSQENPYRQHNITPNWIKKKLQEIQIDLIDKFRIRFTHLFVELFN